MNTGLLQDLLSCSFDTIGLKINLLLEPDPSAQRNSPVRILRQVCSIAAKRCTDSMGEEPPQRSLGSGSPVRILRQIWGIATQRCTDSTREERSLKSDQKTNGGSWTRTNEVVRRRIYSPLQLPLCDTPKEDGLKGC